MVSEVREREGEIQVGSNHRELVFDDCMELAECKVLPWLREDAGWRR